LSPAQLAQSWQGKGAYTGVDTYVNTTLPEGSYVVGAAPGQSAYYTTLEEFSKMDGLADTYYKKLQIQPNLTNPEFPPYRDGVTIYKVNHSSTQVAQGNALANSQFGPGGAAQLFVPDYARALTPVYSIPFRK
jgi:hypothetical protein